MHANLNSPTFSIGDATPTARTSGHPELLWFAIAIAALNLPVLLNGSAPGLMFFESAVRDGEWWRVITHPFTHVSWYHFLLDGAAFLFLYHGLIEKRMPLRLGYTAAAAAGSLVAAIWAAPAIQQIGFCGLSGIAHGLAAVSALEWIAEDRKNRLMVCLGSASFLCVIGKCLWEAATQQAFIGFLHFGMMGTPIVICHAGGALGGVLLFAAASRRETRESPPFAAA